MSRLWRYVIRHDVGAAPNYAAPFTTLAICKPKIRVGAQLGDVVMAFASSQLPARDGRHWGRHDVVWAGIVSEKLEFAEYWEDPRFGSKKPGAGEDRPDNIYEPFGYGLQQVPNPSHDAGSQITDLGGRFVLVMSPAWRFLPEERVMPDECGYRMDSFNRRGHRVQELSFHAKKNLTGWLSSGDDNLFNLEAVL